MKALNWLLLTILVSLLALGCGKKSGIEGKIVDGKGEPIANAKIMATQVQPIKGYEQFEATTGSDGTFRLSKLFPTSEYILFPWSEGWGTEPGMILKYEPTNMRAHFHKEGWKTEHKMTVQSGPDGQTLLLSAPIVIQPAISTVEGKLVDGKEKPIPNVNIVAKHSKAMKGYEKYEQFEATTNTGGTFRFGKLFPNSEYVLLPQMGDWTTAPIWTLRYKANKLKAHFNKGGWTTEQKMKVQTGPEGQTILLASPIVIQPSISSLEGKVVDGKGRALANIKVIAKQVKPVSGYEHFEATTGSDGTFRFVKLFSSSKYILLPHSDDWKTSVKKKVKSGQEEQKLKFKYPLVIRFTMSKAGIITDSRTGLQWAPDPGGGDVNWSQANAYTQRLKLGGNTDWRLPTMVELRSLYDKSLKTSRIKIDPLFRLRKVFAFSSSEFMRYQRKLSTLLNFRKGTAQQAPHYAKSQYEGGFAVLAVRSPN